MTTGEIAENIIKSKAIEQYVLKARTKDTECFIGILDDLSRYGLSIQANIRINEIRTQLKKQLGEL